jgi:hypothetical protein
LIGEWPTIQAVFRTVIAVVVAAVAASRPSVGITTVQQFRRMTRGVILWQSSTLKHVEVQTLGTKLIDKKLQPKTVAELNRSGRQRHQVGR